MAVETHDKLLLTVNDLCGKNGLLSISRSGFFTQRSLGRIPLQTIRIGSKLLFRADEVRSWVNQLCPAKNWQWQPETKR